MKSVEEITKDIMRLRDHEELDKLTQEIVKCHEQLRIGAIKKSSNVVFNFPLTHKMAVRNGDAVEILKIKGNMCEVFIEGYKYEIQKKHFKKVDEVLVPTTFISEATGE